MGTPAIPPQSTRSKYPGMRFKESNMMRDWLGLHESEYDRFDYNVRIGVGRDPGPQFADWVRKAAIMSSQMRVDCVAWKGDVPLLIELKVFAFARAVQQITTYGAVWAAERPGTAQPQLLLVVRGMDDSAKASAAAAGLRVEVLGRSSGS